MKKDVKELLLEQKTAPFGKRHRLHYSPFGFIVIPHFFMQISSSLFLNYDLFLRAEIKYVDYLQNGQCVNDEQHNKPFFMAIPSRFPESYRFPGQNPEKKQPDNPCILQ